MKLDLWNIRIGAKGPLDFYPLIRPFLFQIDPELAHTLTLKMLGFRFKGFGLGPQGSVPD
ncbi:MAG: hypothetical protein HGA90_07860, partial [Alphaproteobacteria bacterium]|nr:hypothetical protein [Alphaproteobacteria bacterium]